MKALCVFSGGLDSILAAELIRAQGLPVLALFFQTPFFSSSKAENSARTMNLPIRVIDITERHMNIVKNPKHGYGSNMNPCIDCHSLMFRIAGEMLEEEDADFIVSGEVLGQRPMSQNKTSLAIIAEESGMNGFLVRPLSAKLLPLTIPEIRGWIERERLMGIQGRSRKPQIELANEFKVTSYPSPAGGCLLTEKAFSRRLRDLFSLYHRPEIRRIELLKVGRHFRFAESSRLVVGRNKTENKEILSLAGPEDIIMNPISVPGPTSLLMGRFSESDTRTAAAIAASYSDAESGSMAHIRLTAAGEERVFETEVSPKGTFKNLMI